ncbi:hypothetical protein Tco_1091169 [Tanacetum coccineum]|uniref:Uncharacterized protein n=1 Tax=Tanacetum coccineum TaxID=301880 RepID=A0ABQ5I7D5_9ASTR
MRSTLRGCSVCLLSSSKDIEFSSVIIMAQQQHAAEVHPDELLIIMAQQQHAADVHPDELCPPNKRYDLMDANKKVDLEHVQCPPESKILTNIIQNHPLRFSIATSLSVPWIYMAQQIFHLPQATANNHNSFVPPPSFSDMVPFYKQVLGFTMELKTQSNFKTTGLLQPWKTLCKIFSKCLTTRVTGWDQPPLQIMQMLYCFVNNIHVDYAELLWEGLYYSLHHPTSSIPYPRFTKDHFKCSKKINCDSSSYLDRRFHKSTPPAPVPTVDKADEIILQDTLQVSLTKHKSREEQEARKNVALVDEHLASEEIEKMVSNKESPEVEITKEKEVEIIKETLAVDITNIVIPVNVTDEDEEITDEVYELKRGGKGSLQNLRFIRYKSCFHEFQGTFYGYLFTHLRARFMLRKSFDTLADNLHDVMVETLPTMVDKHVKEQVMKQVPEQVRNQVPVYVAEGLILERQKAKEETERLIAKAILYKTGTSHNPTHIKKPTPPINLLVHPAHSKSFVPEQQYQLYLAMKANPQLQQQDIAIWLALQMKFERNTVLQTACRTPAVRPRYQDDPHDDAHPEGENSAKRQKTSEYKAYVSGESSYGQMANEMLRQRCTSGDKHQYHIDQMKNFLKSDIVWESRKEILVSLHPRKITPLVHRCQKDPKAPALSLINQDLLYLKKGNYGPEKIVLSLHYVSAII